MYKTDKITVLLDITIKTLYDSRIPKNMFIIIFLLNKSRRSKGTLEVIKVLIFYVIFTSETQRLSVIFYYI